MLVCEPARTEPVKPRRPGVSFDRDISLDTMKRNSTGSSASSAISQSGSSKRIPTFGEISQFTTCSKCYKWISYSLSSPYCRYCCAPVEVPARSASIRDAGNDTNVDTSSTSSSKPTLAIDNSTFASSSDRSGNTPTSQAAKTVPSGLSQYGIPELPTSRPTAGQKQTSEGTKPSTEVDSGSQGRKRAQEDRPAADCYRSQKIQRMDDQPRRNSYHPERDPRRESLHASDNASPEMRPGMENRWTSVNSYDRPRLQRSEGLPKSDDRHPDWPQAESERTSNNSSPGKRARMESRRGSDVSSPEKNAQTGSRQASAGSSTPRKRTIWNDEKSRKESDGWARKW
jgi:hypothetical protein